MNLKNRMNSGSPSLGPTTTGNEPMRNSDSIMQNSNLQPQDSILQRQSETIRKQAAEIQEQSRTIQTLSLEKSELTSAIANLRAELSSVQSINQLLTTDNQRFSKENDDLRNNAGLLSKKEQDDLIQKLANTQALLSDAKKKINMSNVEAVQAAQAAQKAAERKAENDIADYKKGADKRVADAISAKNAAICQAEESVASMEKKQKTAWGFSLATLLCCLIAYPAFLLDVWYFFSIPAVWAWKKLKDYAHWMKAPYYPKTVRGTGHTAAFPTGWAWVLRLLTILLILACIAVICYGICRLVMYYRKRWCSLSLEVLLGSIDFVIIFGETVQSYTSWNLVLILLVLQAFYLGVLTYFDGYYDARNRTDDWERIQNA